jgi:hypothetical protein
MTGVNFGAFFDLLQQLQANQNLILSVMLLTERIFLMASRQSTPANSGGLPS